MLRRSAFFFAVFCLAAVGADVPRPAPPATFSGVNGPNIEPAKYRGKVVVLEFLSTICEHCQRTSARLEKLYRELGPRGVQVLGVATNPGAFTLVPEFVQTYGLTFPVGFTEEGKMHEFLKDPPDSIPYVPHTVFIDRQGTIRDEHVGEMEEKELRERIENLLKAGPAPAPKPAAKKNP